MASRPKSVTQGRLVEARSSNLRQLLLRATRVVSGVIEEELARRGYDDVRLSHSTLLAHLGLDGNTITQVAARAQMTKQAVGVLAADLEAMGYLTRRAHEHDGRARVLAFTKRGRKLLLVTLTIVDEIEQRCTARLGEATMNGLRAGLQAISNFE